MVFSKQSREANGLEAASRAIVDRGTNILPCALCVTASLLYALQIQLFEGAGKGTAVPWEDQYDTALAYLAEGFTSRRPQHVRTALKLLGSVTTQTELGPGPADIGECVHTARAA